MKEEEVQNNFRTIHDCIRTATTGKIEISESLIKCADFNLIINKITVTKKFNQKNYPQIKND